MKKQELIKHIEDLPYKEGLIVDKIDISRKGLLELVKQLDELGKVQIPQFVADWIKHSKTIGCSLFGAMSIFEENTEIKKWMQWADNQETFARAWLDGYEIGKEKRYTVVMKTTKQPLYYNAVDKKLFFSMGGLATNFTQQQLEEAGFGWVFDCPGMQIEEVE